MKRSPVRATAVLMSVGALALVAACGNSNESASPGTSPTSAAATTGAAPSVSASASASESPSATASSKEPDKTPVPGAGGSDGVFTVGTLLPQTGSLAFLGPPEEAGVQLAINDINAAGGTLGKPAVLSKGDSGDTTTDIATQTVTRQLAAKADLILGAASSGVSLTVNDKIVNSGVIQFSPANTSTKFTDYPDKDLYFRTAPSDLLQGGVVGNLIVGDGFNKVGILALQDPYGTGLASEAAKAIKAGGGETAGEPIIYDPTAATYDDVVGQMKQRNPDAILLIGFEESKKVITALVAAGIGPGTVPLYGVDGNTGNALGEDLPPGTLLGLKGTTPLTELSKDFEAKLKKIDGKLKDFNYAGESYDAVVVTALAMEVAKTDKPVDAAKEIIGVTKDGTKCTTYADCLKLVKAGTDIDYDGISGAIEFDDKGDPSVASYGVLVFGKDNKLDDTKRTFVTAGGTK